MPASTLPAPAGPFRAWHLRLWRLPAARLPRPALRAVLVALAASLCGPALAQPPLSESPPPPLHEPLVDHTPGLCDECCPEDCWTWQLLPDGLIYRSYHTGRESGLETIWFHEAEQGWLWDTTLGGRVALVRYGSPAQVQPEGWQIDLEGAAFPRLIMEDGSRDLVASDFRFGIPLSYGCGPLQTKFAYYHLSSHVGDEWLLKNPAFQRINYTRDCLVLGNSWYVTPDWRVYAEAGWAFNYSGGAEPWEFQFGFDYSPAVPSTLCGAPFAGVNAYLREEVDFGGSLTVQFGWQWRGACAGHVVRTGFHYLVGKSPQLEFFDENEEQLGVGIWYDF